MGGGGTGGALILPGYAIAPIRTNNKQVSNFRLNFSEDICKNTLF